MTSQTDVLFTPLKLPCGVVLKNRIAKSAMSDSLGDGTGHPTEQQIKLYETWAQGGAAVSIIGEVQGSPLYAEKPGNLVLDAKSKHAPFRTLAQRGGIDNMQLWLQLGHAGALSYPPTSELKGPSPLDLPGLVCDGLTLDEIACLPLEFSKTAKLAQQLGFGGVQIHAAHGFLLSQFLSPLFNQRNDKYGGTIENRMRLLIEIIDAVRDAVGPAFPIAVKMNATDQIEGGLNQEDALEVVEALDGTSVDLIDISGGTYFPGAKSSSDAAGRGPYFLDFAKVARKRTSKPLMLTGGFKTQEQACAAIESGAVDVVGLARALVLSPSLPKQWQAGNKTDPIFPKFSNPPEGGVTAWYTMQLTKLANGDTPLIEDELAQAIASYDARDAARTKIWLEHFKPDTP